MAGKEAMLPAGLIFFEGQESVRQFVIFGSTRIKGQCPKEVFTTSSLQLEYPFLEKEQGEFFRENGKWYFRNLSEEVFTFVAGKNIRRGEAAELYDGAVIRMVNERMLTMVFFDHFVSGRDWRFLNMDDGRHEVSIAVPGTDRQKDMKLSLSYENGRWKMEDLDAAEILHNGIPVQQKVSLRIDDNIEIGENRFVFEGAGLVYGYPVQEGGLSIHIDERSVHKALKKVKLLEDIDLSIDPGELVMILGGSGAGKSTFVHAVTGYEKARASIRRGKLDFYKDYDEVKYQIGFVPQENLIRMEDTVENTVRNAAEMRLPRETGPEERKKRIAAVLETFGLAGKEKERISKLSGGQKKRLSICTEFIASPSLFILDEPDSGLDGAMSRELMKNLKLIACQGKTVLVITHIPDRAADLFDKVVVLAKSPRTQAGQLAFYGGIQEAKDFFGVGSMEDIVRRINSENEGGEGRADEFVEKFREYEAGRGRVPGLEKPQEEAPEEDREPGTLAFPVRKKRKEKHSYRGRLGQILVYLGKQFRLMIGQKNWKFLPMAAAIAFLVVYVMGRDVFQNMEYTKYGSLAMVCICIWNGMFNSIQVVVKERDIIKREHRTGLHISSYLASHMIFQAFLCMMQVVISLVIFKVFGMQFPSAGLFSRYFIVDLFITMFLVTYASDMMALMISCITHSGMTAMTIMPFVLVVQLVFAGGIFPLNRMGAEMIAKYTISSWGIRAVNTVSDVNSMRSIVLTQAVVEMDAEGDQLMIELQRMLEDDEEFRFKIQYFTAGKMQDQQYDHTRENLFRSWEMLLLFAGIYALIGLIFLEMVDRDKR